MKDLLTIGDLGADGIHEIMHAADSFAEVCQRPIPKVPALRGKTIASMFFEDSTRTRTSRSPPLFFVFCFSQFISVCVFMVRNTDYR